MSKKDKIKNIDMDDLKALPDVLDGRHHVIPIVTGGDEVLEEVNVPEILPILTLRSSVLFPGAITPITVGREKSIRLVREVNERNGLLGAVLQRESEVEDPAPDDMYKVGTAARIIKILEMPNGNLTVILNGLEKIEVKEYVSTEPYFQASVTPLRDSSPDVKSLEFEALVDSIRDIALGIIAISPDMPKEAAFAIKNIDSKRGIINFICSNLELSDEDRQSLLESPGLLARARKLLEILVREQQLVELKNEIQSRVKQEIDKQQALYEWMEETNYDYLSDERVNLNVQLSQPIIVIGDIGRWNGRVMGYKDIPSGNIRDCLYADTDYTEWYVDKYGDLRADATHHDGTNHYLYRVFKDGVSETQMENLRDKIYHGKATRADITRLTRRLGDEIAAVYGFDIPKQRVSQERSER